MKEILFHCFLLNPADLSIIYRYCNDNTLYVNRHILNKAKDFFSNLSILSGIDSNNFIMSYFRDNYPEKHITPRDKLSLKKALSASDKMTSFFEVPCGLTPKEFQDFKTSYKENSTDSLVLKYKTVEIPDCIDTKRVSRHPTDAEYSEIVLTPLQAKYVKFIAERFGLFNGSRFDTDTLYDLIDVIDQRLHKKKLDTLFSVPIGNILNYKTIQPILNRLIRSETDLKTYLTEIDLFKSRYLNINNNSKEEYKRMLSEIADKCKDETVLLYVKDSLASFQAEPGKSLMDNLLDFALKYQMGDAYECEFIDEYNTRIKNGDNIDTIWKSHFKNMVMYYITLKIFENSTLYPGNGFVYDIESLFNVSLTNPDEKFRFLKELCELNELGLYGIGCNTDYEFKAINDVWSINSSNSHFLNSEFNIINSDELTTNQNIQFICTSLQSLIVNELGYLTNRG